MPLQIKTLQLYILLTVLMEVLLCISGWTFLLDYSALSKDYYKKAAETGGYYLSAPYLNPPDSGTDRVAITTSYPVKDSSGKILGVAAIDLSLNFLKEYIDEISSIYNADVTVFTKDGLVIYNKNMEITHDTENIPDFNAFSKKVGLKNSDEFNKLIAGGKDGQIVLDFINNPAKVVVTRQLEGSDWVITTGFPRKVINERIIGSVLTTTSMNIIFVLLSTACSLYSHKPEDCKINTSYFCSSEGNFRRQSACFS